MKELNAFRKYLAEGTIKEEIRPEPKFKIGDKVTPTPQSGLGKGFKGIIWNVYMNEPENLEIKDGEYIYIVEHDNYRGNMVMSYRVKESNLIKSIEDSDSIDTDVVTKASLILKDLPNFKIYIKSLSNDIRLNGDNDYVTYSEEDWMEDYDNYMQDRMDS